MGVITYKRFIFKVWSQLIFVLYGIINSSITKMKNDCYLPKLSASENNKTSMNKQNQPKGIKKQPIEIATKLMQSLNQAKIYELRQRQKYDSQLKKLILMAKLSKTAKLKEQKKWENQGQCIYTDNPFCSLKKVMVSQIVTRWKPPHRYKTRIIQYENSLVLFGGLGCEKNLTWAKLLFNPLRWELPNHLAEDCRRKYEYCPLMPLYGHSMANHKSIALIYGGMRLEETSSLVALNLKSMKMTEAARAPFRRREHAVLMIGRHMIVHGGIENREVKNDLFSYDAEDNQWSIIQVPIFFPHLCQHGMAAHIFQERTRKKHHAIFELVEWVYLFGGRNQRMQESNKLYRFMLKNQSDVEYQELFTVDTPFPRYSFVFHAIDQNSLLLYGGRQNDEVTDAFQKEGVFSDVHIYKIEQRKWVKPIIPEGVILGHRHGMASALHRNKIYIFGGFEESTYANGDVLMMSIKELGSLHTQMYITENSIKTPVCRG